MPTQYGTESKFTRAEFYELVWSKPATHIAKELGCSDSEIGTLCKSHDIPKPFAGYWMMLAHGKAPERPPLPDNEAEARRTIRVVNRAVKKVRSDHPEPQYDQEITRILEYVCKRPGAPWVRWANGATPWPCFRERAIARFSDPLAVDDPRSAGTSVLIS
ncbi:hypothetical protein Enr13x_57240 [Stieleria neptunia]|uniref:Uncharacterized protein n=1 Tax=Stieleria neptunia TaxID=2527979 RepID=A0A518HY84_9BACT|nr:hypothetical protein Enr13x_57240 [Stieleria neptunia]